MRFFAPDYMDQPDQTYSENFIQLMLKYRPKFAVIWDIDYQKLKEIKSRAYVVEYFVIREKTLYYSNLKPFAKKMAKELNIEKTQEINLSDQDMLEKALPIDPKNKRFRFWAPGIVEDITEIDLNDFLPLMLKIRPQYCVLWDVELKDVDYMAFRVYVVSYMPVIGNTIYYTHSKHHATACMKRFKLERKEKFELGTYVPEE